MKHFLFLCWVLTAFWATNLKAAESRTPEINECLDPSHPSGLNLENIKKRAQDIDVGYNDPSIKVITYINLKERISKIFKASSKVLNEDEKDHINKLISCSTDLKIQICDIFNINYEQLTHLKEVRIPSLTDALYRILPVSHIYYIILHHHSHGNFNSFITIKNPSKTR